MDISRGYLAGLFTREEGMCGVFSLDFGERGGGQLGEEDIGVDVDKKHLFGPLQSSHWGQNRVTKWQAFATPWIPVLRERRASRRQRDDGPEKRTDCALC